MQKSVLRLTDLYAVYISRADLRESSVAVKNRAVKWFVEAIGDLPVDEIRFAHAEDYRKFVGKGRQKESANIYLKNIKPFFNWLVRCGHITQSPFEGLRDFKTGQKSRQPYSAEEIARIMQVAGDRWKVIVLLGLLSLRRAEVLNLTVRDIYFDKGYITITPKEDTAETWRWEIKDHNRAIVPMPPVIQMAEQVINLQMLLINLIESLPQGQPYLCLRPKTYQLMMRRKAANELTWEMRISPWRSFSRDFCHLCRRAAVVPRGFQGLRTTFASKMVTSGLTLVETQKLMRHSSPSTTAMYYVSLDEQKLAAKSAEICEKCYVT